MNQRKMFSVCIPSYNRSKYLVLLLDSICQQDFKDFEIIVCEDLSPEREVIAGIVREYQSKHDCALSYYENKSNLGYDGNIRNLVEKANGEYCFFMGNDDLMCPGALSEVAGLIRRHPDVGMVLKSYSWFQGNPDRIDQTVKYYSEERRFKAGEEAIHACFRRSGVIAGYIIHRDSAHAAATSRFDGTLFYQMHLTVSVLASMSAVFTPKVLVLCRNGVPPDFGNSGAEQGKYIPGRFTPQARLNMVGGALSILEELKLKGGGDYLLRVKRDYANYFYPCIKDQLNLPLREYFSLYRNFGRLGFDRFVMFHVYSVVCYIIGEQGFDGLIRLVRKLLGRSPHFGQVGKVGTMGRGM